MAGWFSFDDGHATAGDLLARDLACQWLAEAGRHYDVAAAAPFTDGVNWCTVDAIEYSHVVFVCGPFEQRADLELRFLKRFEGRTLIGLDLSMLVPLDEWNPFNVLFERDSSRRVNPDIVFCSPPPTVPVVGVCLVEAYDGADTDTANAAIRRLIAANEAAVIEIDTRLDANCTGLRTASEIESLIARVDVLITTRLHGAVLALKNGVPTIAIDAERGGAKIRRQAESIGWPIVFTVDAISDQELQRAFDYCLTPSARKEAVRCFRYAAARVQDVRDQFIGVFKNDLGSPPEIS